jgi:hypothetical protein
MACIPEGVQSFIASRIEEGFDSGEQIIEDAAEHARDEHGLDDLEPQIERITAELLAEHRQEQSGWIGPTDCDKLDAAFDDLEEAGIVARQNFSCCSNCGHGEIWGEIEETQAERKVTGYVFYHMQDTEGVCSSGSLYLKFGAVAKSEKAMTGVGRKIVRALTKQGLHAVWNGDPGRCVEVHRLQWRRRR